MDTNALETARKEVADLEAKMLDDITTKAKLLGYDLVKDAGDNSPAPKTKRKRRTKDQIAADNANQAQGSS